MKKYTHFFLFLFCTIFINLAVYAQKAPYSSSKFQQLGQKLPTPNVYRTADGSPGPLYWQQKADYKIKVKLDDKNQSIKASETVTYFNNAPTELTYLWVQLDQNRFDKNSDSYKTMSFTFKGKPSYQYFKWVAGVNSEGGFKVSEVKDSKGKGLKCTINKTMMRIELPTPLKPKDQFTFSLDWEFNINDVDKMGGRAGFEYFPKDKNYIYEMAQWFPRMCVYNDVNGWQNKQFLGNGEFALTFGDYEVAITVPKDHIVASTGELQNPKKTLSSTQIKRLEKAKKSDKPIVIVTQDEVINAEKSKAKGTKTWVYKAENVRDFAWATSRKFIWDAMQIDLNGKKVWAMSYYPKEGNPLWGEKSTNVVAHTLRSYSKYTFDYPYPVAISVHGPVFGMEYPMICFNGGRPKADGTVPDRTKFAMISVITHEVGHNFFPMIVNSDERQWTWMDEGLNSFLQYRTEQEMKGLSWAKDLPSPYPSRRGPAKNIVSYMKGEPKSMVPIMTNSEQILQFGNNAYGKPATALNILRETVMGEELFDYAFKSYANKWKFKHPEPADLFRTMEDASGVDLDWFWRGWFYTTEPCDIVLDDVKLFTIDASYKNKDFNSETIKKKDFEKYVDIIKSKAGFSLNKEEEETLNGNKYKYYFSLTIKNEGGLIMPVIVEAIHKDGSKTREHYPAEIWRKNNAVFNKLFITDKEVVSFKIDPDLETADINVDNNIFPKK